MLTLEKRISAAGISSYVVERKYNVYTFIYVRKFMTLLQRNSINYEGKNVWASRKISFSLPSYPDTLTLLQFQESILWRLNIQSAKVHKVLFWFHYGLVCKYNSF